MPPARCGTTPPTAHGFRGELQAPEFELQLIVNDRDDMKWIDTLTLASIENGVSWFSLVSCETGPGSWSSSTSCVWEEDGQLQQIPGTAAVQNILPAHYV